MREIRLSGLMRGTRCEPGPYSTGSVAFLFWLLRMVVLRQPLEHSLPALAGARRGMLRSPNPVWVMRIRVPASVGSRS